MIVVVPLELPTYLPIYSRMTQWRVLFVQYYYTDSYSQSVYQSPSWSSLPPPLSGDFVHATTSSTNLIRVAYRYAEDISKFQYILCWFLLLALESTGTSTTATHGFQLVIGDLALSLELEREYGTSDLYRRTAHTQRTHATGAWSPSWRLEDTDTRVLVLICILIPIRLLFRSPSLVAKYGNNKTIQIIQNYILHIFIIQGTPLSLLTTRLYKTS